MFIDTTNIPTATLLYNATSTNKINILGHLVIPVYNPGLEGAHYSTVDSANNLVLPTAGVPLDLKNQVVFVPKGTSYTVYDKTTDTNNPTGYILLPVGNTDFLSAVYPYDDINYQLLSSGPYYVYDENGNSTVPKSSEDFRDYLVAKASSSKPYWWNVNTPLAINKYFDGIIYSPDQTNTAYTANYPVGRYANLIAPIGEGTQEYNEK